MTDPHISPETLAIWSVYGGLPDFASFAADRRFAAWRLTADHIDRIARAEQA